MAAVTVHSDFGAKENQVCHCFPFGPSICHEVMGPDSIILVLWMLSFKQLLHSPLSTLIKRLFSSSSLSAIRQVSFTYLRLLTFLLTIFIPTSPSFSLVFCMMYSAEKLNKPSDNIQPWCTPFPILNQSVVTCPVLLLLLHLHSGFSEDR